MLLFLTDLMYLNLVSAPPVGQYMYIVQSCSCRPIHRQVSKINSSAFCSGFEIFPKTKFKFKPLPYVKSPLFNLHPSARGPLVLHKPVGHLQEKLLYIQVLFHTNSYQSVFLSVFTSQTEGTQNQSFTVVPEESHCVRPPVHETSLHGLGSLVSLHSQNRIVGKRKGLSKTFKAVLQVNCRLQSVLCSCFSTRVCTHICSVLI